MRLHLAAIIAAFVTLAGQTATAEEPLPKLVLATGVGAPYVNAQRQGFLDLLVAELGRRLGRQGEMVVYPSAARALMNANSGVDDGDALRVAGLEAVYPNLIRVPEKVIDNNFVGYVLDRPQALRDLANGFETLRPYHVGYIVGWKIFENGLKDGFKATPVQDAEQLFTLLRNVRADVVLFEHWQGRAMARAQGLRTRYLQPPLATTEMFIYFNRKHEALVEPAAAALREMKRDGSYQRIWQASLGALGDD